jgi:voltage-gated sodium channel
MSIGSEAESPRSSLKRGVAQIFTPSTLATAARTAKKEEDKLRRATLGPSRDSETTSNESEQDDMDKRAFNRVLKGKPSSKRAPGLGFVDGACFTQFIGVSVLVNICTIGLSVDYDYLAPGVFTAMNTAFLLVYFVESFLRLMAHGLAALNDPLTLMDLLLNIITFTEALLSEEARYARALPVLRLIRIGRYLRTTKFFRTQRELWMLCSAMSNALSTLFWVLVILGIFLLSVATWAHSIVGESNAWVEKNDPLNQAEPFDRFDNFEYFGSVSRSFLSMVQIITLSQWADHIARQVVTVYPVTFIFFAMFLFASAYGLLMCVVSNVVLSSIVSSKSLQTARLEIEREVRNEISGQALRIFVQGDEEGSGKLSRERLEEELLKPALPRVLKQLEVPYTDADSLILLFDHTGDGTVDYEEMVRGVTYMNEDIIPQDFVKLNIRAWALLKRAELLDKRLDKMTDDIGDAARILQAALKVVRNMKEVRARHKLREDALEKIRTVPNPLPVGMEAPKDNTSVSEEKVAKTANFLGWMKNFMGELPSPKSLQDKARPASVEALRRAASVAVPPPLRLAGVQPPEQLIGTGMQGPMPLPDQSSMMRQICGKAVLPRPQTNEEKHRQRVVDAQVAKSEKYWRPGMQAELVQHGQVDNVDKIKAEIERAMMGDPLN